MLDYFAKEASPCEESVQAYSWVMFSLTHQPGAVAWGESSSYGVTLHKLLKRVEETGRGNHKAFTVQTPLLTSL